MTNTKLFVGNLSFKTTEAELEETFSKSGTVVSVAIPTDRETGRKRGFGFVEMETKEMADAAVKEFNGQSLDGRQSQSLDGRQIVVNESKPREAAPAPRKLVGFRPKFIIKGRGCLLRPFRLRLWLCIKDSFCPDTIASPSSLDSFARSKQEIAKIWTS